MNVNDIIPPGVLTAFARQDEHERRQDEQERLSRQADREDRQLSWEFEDRNFAAWHGYSRSEYTAAMFARPESTVDRARELGSKDNPVVMIDGVPLRPREPARSARPDPMEATLARARELSRDPGMLRRCREYHEREVARQSAQRRAEIEREESWLTMARFTARTGVGRCSRRDRR